MTKLAIKNAIIMDVIHGTSEQQDCYIANRRFVSFNTPPEGFVADKIIDATGCWLMPGLVDLSVNLLRKNQNDLLSLAHSLEIAQAHGIKILCQWPVQQPAFDNPITVRAVQDHFSIQGKSQLLPIASMTENLAGETLTNYSLLKEAGAIGFSQGDRPIANAKVLYNAFQYAATFDLQIFIRPNDSWFNQEISIHQGAISAMLGIEGIPIEAEVLDLQRCLTLAKRAGVKIHFSGISSREGVEVIRRAKNDGLRVTADVAIPNLFLTEMDVATFEPACHLIPPLRSLSDQDALLAAIEDGTIDAISSHNRSCSLIGKQNPLALTPPGYHGFTAFLPLLMMLSEKTQRDFVDILRLATKSCYDILAMDCPSFKEGSIADFVLFNPNLPATNIESPFQSPFADWYLSGQIELTCFDGYTGEHH